MYLHIFWNSLINFCKKILEVILIILIVLSSTNLCLAQDSLKTIAVLDFQNNSIVENKNIKTLEKGLSAILISVFSNIPNLEVVNRSRLSEIFKRLAIVQSGMLEKTKLEKIAKLSGAQYFVLGSFIKGFDDDVRIDCRIVNTENGEIIKSEEITGNFEDIFELTNDLCHELLGNLNIELTDKENESIDQSLKGCTPENLISYSLALVEMDAGNKKNAKEILEKLTNDCPGFKAANDLLQECIFTGKK